VEAVGYAVLALLGFGAAWWVIKVSTGLLLPLETTARAYLSQLLKKMEISQIVPEPCVAECVAESIRFARTSAKFSGKTDRIRDETVRQLELQASLLHRWIRGSDAFSETYEKAARDLFERHRVPRLNYGQKEQDA